jgi:carboxypeptidase family protein
MVAMKQRTKPFLAAACLSMLTLSACAGSGMAPAAPTPTFTVSGIVFERTPSGTEAVPGAWVEEITSHRGAPTDKNGFFSIAGLAAGNVTVQASGSYYYVATVTFPISGNTTKDIEIVEVRD